MVLRRPLPLLALALLPPGARGLVSEAQAEEAFNPVEAVFKQAWVGMDKVSDILHKKEKKPVVIEDVPLGQEASPEYYAQVVDELKHRVTKEVPKSEYAKATPMKNLGDLAKLTAGVWGASQLYQWVFPQQASVNFTMRRESFEALMEQDLARLLVEQDGSGSDAPPRAGPKRKMMIGILTDLSEKSKKARAVIRETWMTHPDVCSIENVTDGCSIRVAFVAWPGDGLDLGRRNHNNYTKPLLVRADEPDVCLIDGGDREAGGTFVWFQLASRIFTDVDFIAKASDDIFLHVDSLLAALPGPGAECEAYIGKPWACQQKHEACPKAACGPPLGRNWTAYGGGATTPDCWSYMQGPFYALSRRLAADVSVAGSYFDHHKEGPEDVMTGQAIKQLVASKQICVSTWSSADVKGNRVFYAAGGLQGSDQEAPAGAGEAWESYDF